MCVLQKVDRDVSKVMCVASAPPAGENELVSCVCDARHLEVKDRVAGSL